MTTHDYDTLDITHADGVAQLTIAGCNEMNALDPATTRDLRDASIELADDPDVRCISITGAGETFGVGADLSQFDGDETDAARIRDLATDLHEAILQLHTCETPIVTGVDGVAAGAGFSLAITGDLVILSEEATLKFAYPQIGLTGDGGATYFLPRLVGLRTAKELVLRDEPIDAEAAVELGLATEAVPPAQLDDRLTDVTSQLAAGPTNAFGRTKRLLTESYSRDLAGQLAAETEAMADSIHTADYEEGLAAFLADREPAFEGQ